jgi:hypothetical protein
VAHLELGFEHTDLIKVAQDRVRWHDVADMHAKFGIRNWWGVFGTAEERGNP